MKDFYNDSFKFLKTEKETRKLKNIILCSWIDRITIVKVTRLPKVLYRLIENPIKIPTMLSTEIGKILRFIWNQKRPWIDKAILSKKNNTGGIINPEFKIHYKAIIKRTIWYWHKNRYNEIKIEDQI